MHQLKKDFSTARSLSTVLGATSGTMQFDTSICGDVTFDKQVLCVPGELPRRARAGTTYGSMRLVLDCSRTLGAPSSARRDGDFVWRAAHPRCRSRSGSVRSTRVAALPARGGVAFANETRPDTEFQRASDSAPDSTRAPSGSRDSFERRPWLALALIVQLATYWSSTLRRTDASVAVLYDFDLPVADRVSQCPRPDPKVDGGVNNVQKVLGISNPPVSGESLRSITMLAFPGVEVSPAARFVSGNRQGGQRHVECAPRPSASVDG